VTSLPFDLPVKQEPREEVITVYTTKTIADRIRNMAEDSGHSVASVGHHIFERALTTTDTPKRRATDAE
jgi:hypothetical protein